MTSDTGSSTMASRLGLAAEAGIRLAVAESLTGGMLADAFVSIPGASRVFSGAIVAYDTSLKRSLLGVDSEMLRARGPVDPGVAEQMALGVRRACAVTREGEAGWRAADIGLSTTGVAGPDADPATGQPPGTVWVGVSSRRGERSVAVLATGDRASIRAEAVRMAIREFTVELRELIDAAAGLD